MITKRKYYDPFDFYHDLLTDEFQYNDLSERIDKFCDMMEEEITNYQYSYIEEQPLKDKALLFLREHLPLNVMIENPRPIIEGLLDYFNI